MPPRTLTGFEAYQQASVWSEALVSAIGLSSCHDLSVLAQEVLMLAVQCKIQTHKQLNNNNSNNTTQTHTHSHNRYLIGQKQKQHANFRGNPLY